MATFSCWTVGPAKISKCGHLFGKDEKIGISPVHSWMNFILTTGLIISHFIDLPYWPLYFPTTVLAILVTMIFLLHGDYILCCKCCSCCSCCTISNCNNNVQYTVLNTTTMEEEFPIHETTNRPSPSPTNMSCICSCNCYRNCLSYFFVSLLIASLLIFPMFLAIIIISY